MAWHDLFYFFNTLPWPLLSCPVKVTLLLLRTCNMALGGVSQTKTGKKTKTKKSHSPNPYFINISLPIFSNFHFSFQTCPIQKLKPFSSFILNLKSLTYSLTLSLSLSQSIFVAKEKTSESWCCQGNSYLPKKKKKFKNHILIFSSLPLSLFIEFFFLPTALDHHSYGFG